MLEIFLKNRKKNVFLLLMASFFLNSCSVFKPVKNEGEPRFTEYYFTDKDENRIGSSVSPSLKYIYLNIITENAIGEKVTISMDEETETDYIYKGKYLSKQLRFKIRNNKEKIKLNIYNDQNRKHRRLKEKAMNSIKDK